MNYMLLFKLFAYILTPLIVSDSIYSVFVLKNIETSTINSYFIKTDNGPAYISRHFKQFSQSFSIKHITGIPYNPQTQDIVERTHHTLKLQIKKI